MKGMRVRQWPNRQVVMGPPQGFVDRVRAMIGVDDASVSVPTAVPPSLIGSTTAAISCFTTIQGCPSTPKRRKKGPVPDSRVLSPTTGNSPRPTRATREVNTGLC